MEQSPKRIVDGLPDTGERMLPTNEGEVSFVYSRHEFAYREVAGRVNGMAVLDVGCGTGYGAALLAQSAASVDAIDYSEEAIAYCTSHYRVENLRFHRMRAEDIAWEKRFDAAVSFQVIEHLPDTSLFLHKISSAVKPGGTIFLTTPNAREPVGSGEVNPFHFNEMNFDQFHQLLAAHFRTFELLGIGYKSSNKLRTFFQNSPFYRLGKHFSRSNPIKKIARRSMDLTNFRVLRANIAPDAIDLFAICTNNS